MGVLTFPDIPIAAVTWQLISHTQTFRSPLNGTTQTIELPGARWAADIAFAKMSETNKRILSAWLVSLRGQAGRFYLTDPSNKAAAGTVNGAPVIDTAVSNTPTLLGSSGWVANAAGVLLAGDMIGLSTGELKMVMDDVTADAAGQAIITVEPPCRNLPADGTSIVTDAPTCVMRLLDDRQAAWKATPPKRYAFSLKCEEAIV